MNKYNNGKIYKITPIVEHPIEDVYYGSTTTELIKRFKTHCNNYSKWKNNKYSKTSVFNLFEKYGVENCQIYLIENVNAMSKVELLTREKDYVKNNKSVNVNNPLRTLQEKKAQKAELDKLHYELNKEYIKEYRRQWYQQNKLKKNLNIQS